jgi:hypothetical protein
LLRSFLPLLLPLLLTACPFGGDDDVADAAGPVVDAAPPADARPPADASMCGEQVQTFQPAAGPHVSDGTEVSYATNPPSSGPHYAKWARWNVTYDDPILPRENYVHNLEHGGVVLLYRCDTPCPAVVAGLEGLAAELPQDPKCTPPIRTRTLIVNDPELPAGVQVAAAAWGVTYKASCLDLNSVEAFVRDHVAHGPEDTCAQGSAP